MHSFDCVETEGKFLNTKFTSFLDTVLCNEPFTPWIVFIYKVVQKVDKVAIVYCHGDTVFMRS